jgi:polysaccharide biosynthesis protein PslH
MRILWIKTELLHPIDKGGKIRTFQMLRSLVRQHDVTYLCLDDGSASPEDRRNASEYCTRLITVPFHPTKKGSAAFFLDLVRNVFSGLPYAVSRYRSQLLKERVIEFAPEHDLVICDFLFPSYAVPSGLSVPTVLFQHNVEAMIWERRALVPQNFIRRAYMREQWRRMRRFESEECRRLDQVVAVSTSDADIFRNEYGVSSVSDVPTGVDLEYFSPRVSQPKDNPELIFVGSMDWLPNEDGICWFSEHVFGRVRQQVPNVRLTIVGRTPGSAVRKLAEQDAAIQVTGTVPDVRPYLERGAVFVVPLRIGGGTRLKIYEAMAMGIPMVSTTIGAEGLPVRNEEHLLIADSPEEQATAISRLIQNPHLAAELAGNALKLVKEHGSWDSVTNRFLDFCRDARAVKSHAQRTISHECVG